MWFDSILACFNLIKVCACPDRLTRMPQIARPRIPIGPHYVNLNGFKRAHCRQSQLPNWAPKAEWELPLAAIFIAPTPPTLSDNASSGTPKSLPTFRQQFDHVARYSN